MAERIYVMMTNKSIEPLEETAFGKEATLQTLIAEHPELLDGEQMRPGDRAHTMNTSERDNSS